MPYKHTLSTNFIKFPRHDKIGTKNGEETNPRVPQQT